MKFDCGPQPLTKGEKEKRKISDRQKWINELYEWRKTAGGTGFYERVYTGRIFAFIPLRVGAHDCRFLEFVEYRVTDRIVKTYPDKKAQEKPYYQGFPAEFWLIYGPRRFYEFTAIE